MENTTHNVKSVIADPTPLGLAGLAMVTLVASSQKLGLTEGTSLVIPWAIFLGALAQIMAGFLDFKHNNLFGAIAFSAYGFFWLGVGMSWLILNGSLGEELKMAADTGQLAFAFLGYTIISVILTFAAFRLTTLLSVLMILIVVLLLSLTMDTFGFGGAWHSLAAWSELLISLGSFYGVAAAVLNKVYGRVVVPVGPAWIK